jgi:succinyl-CoA synthetase beta subunit
MEMNILPRQDYVGFHGAGGGGAMMSMDALLTSGFKIANYCDTSGNPSASKVYRAAKIILSQGNIDGYFASGSGVASQEQFNSARGLVKAFREMNLAIPAVIRIGGNSEELAMKILQDYTADLRGTVEAYGRDTSAVFCAQRLRQLTEGWDYGTESERLGITETQPSSAYGFDTLTGRLWFRHERCGDCEKKPCVESCKAGVLTFDETGLPILAIGIEEAKKGKCTECLACELECEFHGNRGISVDLPILGLEDCIGKGE